MENHYYFSGPGNQNVPQLFNDKPMPVPVAARSKAWACGLSLAEIVGSNPPGGMNACECCVLSGRGVCVELITRPKEPYREWFV
jgi:hypothetical protein